LKANYSGISEEEFPNYYKSFEIYPNPTSEYIRIEGAEESPRRIEIYNSAGARVIEATASGSTKIDVSQLNPGAYFVRIEGIARALPFVISR
jgi:hypothetical protein